MALVTEIPQVVCDTCHRTHRRLPRLMGPSAPDDWMLVNVGERLEAELTPDICLLPCRGETRHYLRGHLRLPVHEVGFGSFVWSVWVQLDEDAMTEVARSWTDPDRAQLPAFVGRLANELPYDEPTRGLPVTVHNRGLGEPPLLMVAAEVEHTLAYEQRCGITVHRIAEFSTRLHR